MARNFDDLLAELPADSRARVSRRAAELLAEMPLSVLRMARGLTQEEIAHVLGTTQASVSRLERRDDLHLSTLRRYVAALGGELEITARFPDATVRLDVEG
jgi:DNA-binding XRE family transcriptional regulator